MSAEFLGLVFEMGRSITRVPGHRVNDVPGLPGVRATHASPLRRRARMVSLALQRIAPSPRLERAQYPGHPLRPISPCIGTPQTLCNVCIFVPFKSESAHAKTTPLPEAGRSCSTRK